MDERERFELELEEMRAALRTILPFAKAHAVMHEHIGPSCPWCISIVKAERILSPANAPAPVKGKE